jgi:hypothetical protein
MSVSGVLGEAFDLYRRFFWRFVATAAVVFLVLDLASAFADRASGSSVGAELLWTLIALVLSVVGAFWLQGALIEAVRDVRDGRIDTTIGELYERTRPRGNSRAATAGRSSAASSWLSFSTRSHRRSSGPPSNRYRTSWPPGSEASWPTA